jgi:hypothetical protein
LDQRPDDLGAGRVRQTAKLGQVLVDSDGVVRPLPRSADQKRPLDRELDVDQLADGRVS